MIQQSRHVLRAPAKVNLFLRVHGRRSDGYHLLDSLVVPVGLYDEIDLVVAPAGSREPQIVVRAESLMLKHAADNLAYRAAQAFVEAVGTPIDVEIHVHKGIPVGSGLGGGSSDAAAVLLALNRALRDPISPADLLRIGAGLGADVPFFVYGHPAIVSGVGDQITPLNLGTVLHLVVCWDRVPLPTHAVYARMRQMPLSLTRELPVSNIADFVEGRRPFTDLLVNDLEEAAALIHPAVLSLKAKVMREGAQAALMSGSGSAVFGVWADAHSAKIAATKLRQEALWAEAVHSLELSPAVKN